MSKGLIPHNKVKQFMLAGKALIVIHSKTTNSNFQYHIKQKKAGTYYIYFGVFRLYIGYITKGECSLKYGTNDSEAVRKGIEVFEWVWKRIDRLPPNVEIYHWGTCGACGRPLTDPISITHGIGPECRKKLGYE